MDSISLNLSVQARDIEKRILAIDISSSNPVSTYLFTALNFLKVNLDPSLVYDSVNPEVNLPDFITAMNNIYNYTVIILGSSLTPNMYDLLTEYKETLKGWINCGGTFILLGNNLNTFVNYEYEFLPLSLNVSSISPFAQEITFEPSPSVFTTNITFPWNATLQTMYDSYANGYEVIAQGPNLTAMLMADYGKGHIFATFMALDLSYVENSDVNSGQLILNLLHYGLTETVGYPFKKISGTLILSKEIPLPKGSFEILSNSGSRTVSLSFLNASEDKVTFLGTLSRNLTYKVLYTSTNETKEYVTLVKIPFLVYLERFTTGCCCETPNFNVTGIIRDNFNVKCNSNKINDNTCNFIEVDVIDIFANLSLPLI